MRPKITITRMLVALVLAFIAVQAVQLVISIHGIRHLGNQAEFIEQIGKERVRTLALEHLAFNVVNGAAGAQAQLKVSIREYESQLDQFAVKVKKLHLGERVATPVAAARGAWALELKPLLSAITTVPRDQAAPLARRYLELTWAQEKRIEDIAATLENRAHQDTLDLVAVNLGLLGLSLVLGLIALVITRRRIIAPLDKLVDAAHALREGDYSHRAKLTTRNELGVLGETFDRMAEAVATNTARLTTLNHIALQLTSTLSLQRVLQQVMDAGCNLTSTRAAAIAFYEPELDRFTEWVARGLSDEFQKNIKFRAGGLAEKAFETGTYILSDDRPKSRHKLSKAVRDEGVKSFICLPLISQSRHLGVMYFYRHDRDCFLPEEINLLSTFANLAAGAVDNARLYGQTLDQATTDTLTGLPNRRMFDRRLDTELQRANRYGKSFSLLMLDVDHFKRINDIYGHPAGDAVLKAIPETLVSELREVDLIARYGGEEFIAILPETDGPEARHVAERIRRAMAERVFALPGGDTLQLTVSIGVVSFPSCARDAQTLLTRGDQALYVAKHEGRNLVILYQSMVKTEIERNPGRIADLLNETLDNIPAIVNAVDVKADFLHNHAETVAAVADRLGAALQLAPADREILHRASLLHDVGMITIPDTVLNKPDALTEAEYRVLTTHASASADILAPVAELAPILPAVRHHHERYDGSGYPDGLAGEAIPRLARVLAVADAFAAMISRWPGRRAMRQDEAATHLRDGAGTQFDPAVVDAFMREFRDDLLAEGGPLAAQLVAT